LFSFRPFLHWSVSILLISFCACASITTPSISASTPEIEKSRDQENAAEITLDRLPRAAAYYYFFMADLALTVGQTKLGLEYLNTARQIDPNSAFLEDEMARYYIKKGQPRQALKHARLAVDKNPSYRPARLLLAGLLKAMKHYDEAIVEYEAFLAEHPDDDEALLLLGVLYVDLKQYTKAEEALRRLVELKPRSHVAFFYLGRIALSRKDFFKAEEFFKKALKITPEFEPAFNNLIFIYEKQEKIKQIEEIYKNLIRLNPSANQARLLMARYYLKLGRQKQAQEIFKELKTHPLSLEDLNFRIGLIYFEQNQFQEAIKELQLALDAHPNKDQALYYMSVAYEELKEYQKAIDGFLRIKPESDFYTESRLRLAYIFGELKNLEAGISYLKEAVEQEPQKPILYHSLAALYEENNQLVLAKETVEKGLKVDSESLSLNFRLGVILDKLKDKKGSIKQMKRVIEIDPEHADALNYLAYTWAEMRRNLDEAMSLAQRAVKIKPNAGYIIDTIGWIYFQKGIYSSALKYLKRAVELMPDDPVIHEHLGDTYFKLEQFQRAFDAYLEVQKLGPEDKARLEKKIRDLKKIMR